MWTSGSYWYEHIFTEGGGIFKTFLKENYTVVSYLLKGVKYESEHNINSTHGDIRRFWNLQQIQ